MDVPAPNLKVLKPGCAWNASTVSWITVEPQD